MQFPLTLTENNVRNLVKGRPAGLKKEQLMGDNHLHHVRVHPMTHQKLTMAKAKGRGMRLTMTPQEVQETIAGEGFGDIWRKIKSVGSKVFNTAKNVIQSPEYQEYIKPITKKIVESVVKPAITSVAAPLVGETNVSKAISLVGEKTGAYGLKENASKMHSKPPAKGGRKKKVVGGSFVIS